MHRLGSLWLEIARARDLQAACDLLVRRLADALNDEVALLKRTRDTWQVESQGMPPEQAPTERRLVVPGLEAEVAEVSGGLAAEAVPLGTERWTGVPLGEAGTWLLLLPGAPSGWRSAPWFEPFVRSISPALQLAASAEILTHREHLLRLTYVLTRRLSGVSGGRLNQLIVDTVARAVRAEIGAISVYLPDEGMLAIAATHGYPAVVVQHVRIAPGVGVLGAVFAARKPLLVSDITALSLPQRPRYRTHSFLAVPLMSGETMLGVVAVTDRADGRPFEQSDLITARVLARPAALALAREAVAVQARELARVTSIDALSGLANRREFQNRLEEEAERARRHALDFALMMIDIDGFKAVNDSLGHVAGDMVLQGVARVLQRSVRKFDVCARYGGDEFAIVTPGSNARRALQHAERIRRRLEFLQPEPLPKTEGLRLTASIGIAVIEPGVSSVDLITRADRALYRAKAAGGNCVRLAEPGAQTP